ncbi:MAG: methyltransferase domain-containing protein [Pseudomonadota bacterium]
MLRIASLCPALAAVVLALPAAAHPTHTPKKVEMKVDTSVAREIGTIADGDHRSERNRSRNTARRPGKTLAFFGIEPGMTVVEIAPGGGWYTEILAPYLKREGTLYAAHYDPEHEREYFRNSVARFKEKLAANPALYGDVKISVFSPPDNMAPAPDGSADLVVTFRNTHGWMRNGNPVDAFKAMHRALKPGGVLGVVQHRGDPDAAQDPKAESGYIREDVVIEMAENAGFELVAKSEINANPKDTRDYADGVWTLPPNFRLGDTDREKYAAIGESDRMTLKFVKK